VSVITTVGRRSTGAWRSFGHPAWQSDERTDFRAVREALGGRNDTRGGSPGGASFPRAREAVLLEAAGANPAWFGQPVVLKATIRPAGLETAGFRRHQRHRLVISPRNTNIVAVSATGW
jgi:hypothetical protein